MRPWGRLPPHSTVPTLAEEAMVVAFRRRTLLPLDDVRRSTWNDVLGCLRDSIPKPTRSSLHRCLERHGVSRLPEHPDKASKRGKFAETAIGCVHLAAANAADFRDISELRLPSAAIPTATRPEPWAAPPRASSTWPWPSTACPRRNRSVCAGFTCVEFRDDAGKMNGAEFLRGVVGAFPYATHTVLTDNGRAFADLPKNRNGPTRRCLGAHIVDRVCHEHAIAHKLTKPYHPWTNGQAERMNRTVKEATVKAFHDPDLASLKAHVLAFVAAYNFAEHLKALRWKTPFEAICHA